MITPTAFHRLAEYFNHSELALGVWICAIALVIIFGVGWGCIHMTAETPDEEGSDRGR